MPTLPIVFERQPLINGGAAYPVNQRSTNCLIWNGDTSSVHYGWHNQLMVCRWNPADYPNPNAEPYQCSSWAAFKSYAALFFAAGSTDDD